MPIQAAPPAASAPVPRPGARSYLQWLAGSRQQLAGKSVDCFLLLALQFALRLLSEKSRQCFIHFHDHGHQDFASDRLHQFPIARGPAENAFPFVVSHISRHKSIDHAIPLDGRIGDINDALTRLEQLEPRPAAVVEMRYFGGLTEREIADVLGVSVATVKRDWEFARAWLLAQLNVS